MTIEGVENLRRITLVLLDVAANHMAIRKLLYDAGIASEESFQKAYQEQYDQQIGVFRKVLEESDGQKLRKILEALSKTPHKI